MFQFIARMFGKRAASASLSAPAQWAAVKAAALRSNDARLIEVVRDAEEQAREAIADSYGRAALIFPTDKQLDELCGIALRLIAPSASSPSGFKSEVQHELNGWRVWLTSNDEHRGEHLKGANENRASPEVDG